jgi:hypothetical protein
MFGLGNPSQDLHSVSNATLAATWGTIRGIIRGFWYLKNNLNKWLYVKAWTHYFLSTPFIGGFSAS